MIDLAGGGGATVSGIGTNFELTQKIYASQVDSGIYLNILVDINKPEL